MPGTSSSSFLDLIKNKNRKNITLQKVHRRADGTVVKASETSIKRTNPSISTTNGLRIKGAGIPKSPSRQSNASASRQTGKEVRNPVKQVQAQRAKRSSPVITTPQFTDSDDDDDDEVESRRKRVRIERQENVDEKREIRDLLAFTEEDSGKFTLIHAMDIANSETQEHGRYKYEAFFTALTADEDECPTVDLQYPSASQRERYQVVRPTDQTDFKPLSEIIDNMTMVAEFYVDDDTASKITCPEDGSGMVQRLEKFARDGDKGKPGAQSKFLKVVEEYNALVSAKRKDGTIARYVDEMKSVPLKLVEHIIKNQVYSRTVSPNVHLVRKYEGWSDNVYGELLPRFLSQIFKITHLKSDQIFVDLGSGVGNCVLQAALETGCEAWGCEMMDNCAKLATDQAHEFIARCRMWGIKPGQTELLHGDFLKNAEVHKALKKADVVLVNNQAFTSMLNDTLKSHFLDLKEGCQIVSLKPFRDPNHKIKDTNVNDPVNVFRVQERERFSQMVSWTDDPGKWYLQVKDSTELQKFISKRR